MKILHTSDWHLGHTLYNYDRTEEQLAMLSQMVHIVERERPDVFLLCGDVYHTSQPSASVQTMMAEALVRIHAANPLMTIVVTAGNHDSAARHEIFRTPWQALNVHTIGYLTKDDLERHIIEIPEKGYVIAVPYISVRNMPEKFFQRLLDAVAARNLRGLPVVMMAHTTVGGCDFTGHDHASEFTVGGIDSIDLGEMGEGYDYMALGHIHRGQSVRCDKGNVRYCGTPLPVTFDECFAHTVSLVSIDEHGSVPEIKKIGIDNPYPLVTLPVSGSATWDEAKRLLAGFPDEIPAYIRLNVEVEDFLPVDANAEAVLLTKNKTCRFCYINAVRKSEMRSSEKILSVQEFQSEMPVDIARRYAEDMGVEFDNEMQRLFIEALLLVDNDSRII